MEVRELGVVSIMRQGGSAVVGYVGAFGVCAEM
jgi:hypothetical protein